MRSHRTSRHVLPGPALSLSKPDANSHAILSEKLNAGFLERGHESFRGFGPTANITFRRFYSFDGRYRQSRVESQVVLRPIEQRSSRFNLTN
jgi:hypothetical protein